MASRAALPAAQNMSTAVGKMPSLAMTAWTWAL